MRRVKTQGGVGGGEERGHSSPLQTPQLGERAAPGARLASPLPLTASPAHQQTLGPIHPHDGHTDHPSPTPTVSPGSRPSLPPTLASTVCSLQNSQINASKTHQAIPSQTLERKGLPSVLFSLPPRSHPCSGPLTRAFSVPPDSAGYDCLGPLHLPWPPPANHFPPPYPLILFRSQLGCHLRQAFPNHPLPPPLTTPLPSLVFLSTFYWFIYIFKYKTFP